MVTVLYMSQVHIPACVKITHVGEKLGKKCTNQDTKVQYPFKQDSRKLCQHCMLFSEDTG